ncbi:BspA family leucine-rich repeat surface protein [uncultured Flavobacterium sp.]|uniref:BspA family leucine-rich repeat surface protein n=1 Tax=uncultured Flavobacterium sp. TaxID=165435 RepID=UPI00292F5CA8|nr:BspA family leucine-rich repeat surface protein [uncultured Flavobacterium sp.]
MGSLIQNTVFGRTKNTFISTWRTSNTSTGSSTSTQVKLPLINTGTYNFIVDWGDGLYNTITNWNQAQTTHTYSVAGDYTIKITGTCTGWRFTNFGDRLKILSISKWGKLRLGNDNGYFYGCANLNLSGVSDILDLTGTTTLEAAFFGCTALTTIGRVNEWNMSGVIVLYNTFNSSSFNSNIGNWDVSHVNTLRNTFVNSSFNNGESPDINNWNVSKVANMESLFSGSKFNQYIGNWNTVNVTTMNSMFQGSSFNQAIGTWNVTKVTDFTSMFRNNQSFNNGGTPDINNWVLNSTDTIIMRSMFEGARAFNQTIGNWNTVNVINMSNMFYSNIGTTVFNQNIGSWNVTKVTNFTGMFKYNNSFNNGGNSSINNWILNSVSPIIMSEMFMGSSLFNQPIGNWNTGNVTAMNSMFRVASSFNQNIGAWNVSNVTDFSFMFYVATAFNNGGSPDINNWSLKTTGSISFYQMFISCSNFNQPVGNWNTAAVTDMSQMFQGATKFNQNIGAWNVSNVSSFVSMFNTAFVFNNGGSPDINNWTLKTTGTVSLNTMFQGGGGSYPMQFNQPIGNWNTVAVTDMAGMFQKTGNGVHSFNQPIGNWNTSNVVTMASMFSQGGTDGGTFNQNIGAWNVSNVSDFSNMFLGAQPFNNGGSPDINNWILKTNGSVNMSKMFASVNSYISTTFNQPIGNWNTSAVTNMSQMFGATAGKVTFNQDIGNWNISNVTDFTNFMVNKSPTNFSAANLDAIYNGWSSRTVKTPITITFGTAKRTSASNTGKSILTASPNNWVITDGGI